jgi:2-polyprenyl-3-methyl-5-hydroxy-6-metoxy-1,4-benzoquinol methylase
MGTDSDWEKWGSTDPYFGVLSIEEYRRSALDEDIRDRFFRSGEEHVERVLNCLRSEFDPQFAPESVLDFGSGVGRLVIPFSKRAQRVVGVDVSPSMIAEAEENCRRYDVTNAEFILSDDVLSKVSGQFDLVHSYIVLQHIAWSRGRSLIESLAEKVSPDGFLALQVLVACKAPTMVRALTKLRYAFPPANWVRNLLCQRPIFEAAMQLHVYSIEDIGAALEARGFHNFIEFADSADLQRDFEGKFLIARRT